MSVVQGMVRFGLAASVAVAVTACGGAPVPQAQVWTGTTEYGGAVLPLQVDVAVAGADWSGSYTIGSTPPFTGDVVAELLGGVLTGQLVATTSCSFDLVGAVSDDALEATFTPAACPGGVSGTWSAAPISSASVE
jgi:hypothetical protein